MWGIIFEVRRVLLRKRLGYSRMRRLICYYFRGDCLFFFSFGVGVVFIISLCWRKSFEFLKLRIIVGL